MTWDVKQYERFRDERARPFHDLIMRVKPERVRLGADLGCGTGELTAELAARWPDAAFTGVDSSAEMLAAAAPRAIPGRLEFVQGDAATWSPARPLDLLFSNATFQWLDDHVDLLASCASALAPGGVLAVQMPGNFDAPSHRLLAEARGEGPWAGKLGGMERGTQVHTPVWYAEQLAALGFEAIDVWESTYVHVLPGDDAVLEWIKGTALRPILAKLSAVEQPEFLRLLAGKLRLVYPRGAAGTLFPFRRIFFVATRSP